MKSEPLGLGDRTFLVNRLVQQAPVHTLIREFFKNADENAALASKERLVKIYPTVVDGVRKLTFWNTGVGMTAAELAQATNLSSSINKEMSLDGNFGIGAKVSGLAASPNGIRYRSCRDGRVHQVEIGFDPEQDTYVRFAVDLPDGSSDTVIDVTNSIRASGSETDYDWTEVVLMGMDDAHDTVEFPIGPNVEVDRSFVPTSIFRRFAEFSPGVQVAIDVSMTKGGGRDETGRFRSLKTLSEVIDRLGNSETVVDASSGIAVRYIHDPKHEASSHSLSARANPATGSTTFCALVYKNERYDFRTQKSWSSAAPAFGIPFGSKVLTVEIYLPEGLVMPNQYRDKLLWKKDRSDVSADQLTDFVRNLMPDWVKDVIKSESPSDADDLNDLEADLQTLLDELRVPTQVLKPTQIGVNSSLFDEGSAVPEKSQVEAEDAETVRGGDRRNVKALMPRASERKARKAPEGATSSDYSRALERAPKIIMLTDQEQIIEKGIKGRAAKFYKEGPELFINGLYAAVDRMAHEITDEVIDVLEPETGRKLLLDASRRALALRVGKATCFALAKKLVDDWSTDDLDRATSPESLTLAADDYRQSIPSARRWLKEKIRSEAVAAM
jgi:hypothetical protein